MSPKEKIIKMRREARTFQKRENVSYSEALDIIAEKHNEISWSQMLKKLYKKRQILTCNN